MIRTLLFLLMCIPVYAASIEETAQVVAWYASNLKALDTAIKIQNVSKDKGVAQIPDLRPNTIEIENLSKKETLIRWNSENFRVSQSDLENAFRYLKRLRAAQTQALQLPATEQMEQCQSDLPVKMPGLRNITKHTWLREGVETWGMPYTDEGTYFGGRAHMHTPDPFLAKGPRHLVCQPLRGQASRAACVARKISLPLSLEEKSPDRIYHFDYHAFDRNCLSMVRFVAECVGGQIPLVPNAGVGGKVDWNQMIAVSETSREIREMEKIRREMRNRLHWPEMLRDSQSSLNAYIHFSQTVRKMIQDSDSKISMTLQDVCQDVLIGC